MKKRNVLGLTSIIVGTSALSLSSCSSYGPTLQDYTNNPTAAGFDPIKLDIINGNINEQIERVITDSNGDPSQGFPSLQICVTKNSKVVYNKAFGKSLRFSQGDTGDTTWPRNGYYEELPAVEQVDATTNTLYDLASNTKMYAGMFAIQKLLYERKIESLDDKLSKYIPSFQKQQEMGGI